VLKCPLTAAPAPLEFVELGSIKMAREDVYLDLRNTLAECGVRFTKPPLHFKNLIEECTHQTFQFLDPVHVHEDLLVRVSTIKGRHRYEFTS